MAEAKTLGGYDSSEFWGLIMAGGINNAAVENIASVETTVNGEIFEYLPDLLVANYDFCVVIVDEDKIFTCGGGEFWLSRTTLIFQKSTNSWNR